MPDVFTDALNSPAGRLAEVLLKKMTKSSGDADLSDAMRQRLDKLVDAPGKLGFLARIRLAAHVSFLFEQAPDWTTSKILPLFNWSSPSAAYAWAARKYLNYIGSPELFGLTKQPFLGMFGRNDIPTEDLRTFAEWLTAILVANKRRQGDGYPLTATEARAALRRAGAKVLSSVAHRLAMEMERAKPDDRATTWRTIIGPVFQEIWPLDVELQTADSTFKLGQILRTTGDAFPEAADVIIPFIRPDAPDSHSTIFSMADAPEELYASSPSKMLDFVAAVVGDAAPSSVHGLDEVLDRIRALDPMLANTRKFQKLTSP